MKRKKTFIENTRIEYILKAWSVSWFRCPTFFDQLLELERTVCRNLIWSKTVSILIQWHEKEIYS